MAFEITILGSGAATPTLNRMSSAQVLKTEQKTYLIDCGEGTQMQLLRYGISLLKIDAIFITHLHGDHYLGLPGLLSTMHLMGRKKEILIFAPFALQEIIARQFELTELYPRFEIKFISTTGEILEKILDDNLIEVFSFPLKHRVFCTGYLFKEKIKPRILNPLAVKQYNIPKIQLKEIKLGKDFKTKDGQLISHLSLTYPAKQSHAYAYCSDTAYFDELNTWLKDVNLLYHEATFADDMAERAAETYHSTASQAAIQAMKSNAGCLILGHFSARYKQIDQILKEAKAIFPNVVIAEDGLTIITEDLPINVK